jgi:hypothetical protein
MTSPVRKDGRRFPSWHRLNGLLTRNKLALENVIQVNLSAGINCTVFGCTAQAPAAGLAAPSPAPSSRRCKDRRP